MAKETKTYTAAEEDGLGLFCGAKMPDLVSGWKLYDAAKSFNDRIDLYENVKVNENFFVGKQWEGVQSNGLPTPQFNFLKRVTTFIVASINPNSIKVNITPLANTPNTEALEDPVRIINEEIDAVIEHNNLPALIREYSRDAAVRGDGCIYTYWDPDAETGQDAKGAIKKEVIENTRVLFGNPNDRRVQSQPWIIIENRTMCRNARKMAKENGFEDWRSIVPDTMPDDQDSVKMTYDKVTDLLLLWRNEDDGEIWAYEFTRNCPLKDPWSLGIRLYPLVWLNWDYTADSYHGQAMISGLLDNQMFVNRIWAASMRALMFQAFPKTVYDKTRVAKWDNRIGSAIGINGGDVNNVAKIIDPATISPQIAQFIQLAVSQSEENLGATAVALGDTRPDNTSAIIALQRAAATPSEMTKQNIYQSIEDDCMISIEFMAEYYGKRFVDIATPPQVKEAIEFVNQGAPTQMEMPSEVPIQFDFKVLKNMPMKIKLDVGASSYYSEIQSLATLDNLLRLGAITPLQYLRRIPDGYIPMRGELVFELEEEQRKQEQMAMAQMGIETGPNGAPSSLEASAPPEKDEAGKDEIPSTRGFSDLQRKVMQGEDVR